MDNSYEQQAIDLVKQNEALKAQAEEFRKELDYINSFMAENTEYDLFKRILDWGKRTDLLLLKTPEQCLNSVKADAVDDALSLILSISDGDMCFDILTDRVNELRAINESTV